MKKKKQIVIIGGVAGGASAATRARRRDADADITLLERGPYVSYANCGIPYHLGGEISDRGKLIVAKPELFERRFGINVRTQHTVTEIDRAKRCVKGVHTETGEPFEMPYDRLIISTGANLRELPLNTQETSNFFHLWTLGDLDAIKEYIHSNDVKEATVIGAGFVGLEVVEQLSHLGIHVRLIELLPQVLGPLDPEMALFVEQELIRHDVNVHVGDRVDSLVTSDGRITELSLASGTRVATELVIAGIGVTPNSELAKRAGLETVENACIAVNEFQQTSDPDIYAVGDVSAYTFGPTETQVSIPLAGPANRSGRIAGEHAVTGRAQYGQKVYGTSIVRVFDVGAATTGLSEKLCKKLGITYRVAYAIENHHAGYFPGATPLYMKLLYAPDDGKILGAQIIGKNGADKRIDIISTVQHFGGTVADLATVDLSYAPPYGSAKDPVHQLAAVALNDLDGFPHTLPPASDLQGYQIVDVRTAAERESLPLVVQDTEVHHIPIDDPSGDVRHRLTALDPEHPTVVVCHAGKRAHIVASLLVSLGFSDVSNLTGGMMMRTMCQTAISPKRKSQ